jgi:DNA repair protein RadA/Sms
MVEEVMASPSAKRKSSVRGLSSARNPRRLSEIGEGVEDRLLLPIQEFARVLGGGVVPGSIVLIGGDPGIGKSTLLLQTAMEMSRNDRVLYVSGEESERQIKMRALRLSREADGEDTNLPDDLLLVTETNLEVIFEHVAQVKPNLLIVDSIQTTTLPELESSAGSVSQVRECASRLRELAKSSGISVFLIGHVTKEGTIAGPRGFGATSEVGVFEMQERGMIQVTNPSESFLAGRLVNAPGSAIAVTMEGTRPLLVEIQGLTSSTSFGNPRRTPNGVDMNRLLLIVAVLTRRVGLRLAEQDVFVNVVGGLRVGEPAADLAIAAAIASSIRDLPVQAETVLIGELGLSGELRTVGQMSARLREAANLGFKTAIVPGRLRRSEPWPMDIQVIEARSLRQALDQVLLKD